ncbi:hypothetical protein XENOCAPTIV_003550, partial [Xenoophorus captivus]
LVQVSCGASHVLAVTNEREVFAWGRGDNGTTNEPIVSVVFSCRMFNKLGLDKITAAEEPNPVNQVEEVNSYTPIQSDPLNSERIVYIDIGTAHSVAVTEGEVYTWGKGARGRLGRKEEDCGIPKPVQLEERHPFVVTSVACCHGNTLLAVKRNILLITLS